MAALMRRPSPMLSQSFLQASRSAFQYSNTRQRSLKFKSAARERRRERNKGVLGGIPTPKESGEEIPPFFLPSRNKLFF